jgi:integrase
MVKEFERRCGAATASTAAQRRLIRDRLFHEAGGMNYDHIATEFGKVSRRLGWPKLATIKDFRHLAATCLENAGMPEHYRKFLLGQSPGRAAIVTYTHLNTIREKFDAAATGEFRALIEAIERRTAELTLAANTEREESPLA